MLQESIDNGGKRWGVPLEKEFRHYLGSDPSAKQEYESLGKAYTAQRNFKLKWLNNAFAEETRQLIRDESQTDTQASCLNRKRLSFL